MRICGREFSLDILRRIQEAVSAVPELSRRELSRRVCQWLDWRSDAGAWQEGGCRKALAELHRRGVIELAPIRGELAFEQRSTPTLELEETEFHGTLSELGAVEVVPIQDHRSREAQLWRVLVQRHHYLGDKRLCGAQLRYLIHSEHHGYLGALAFQSGCWALRERDRYIGWSEAARLENLRLIVTNSRFVLLAGVQVTNLASHVLGAATRRLPADWEARYGVRPVLVETFVDPTRFDGGCYRAANWVEVGETAGRRDGIRKRIFTYGLCAQWRERLCVTPPIQLGAWARPPSPAHWAEQEFGTLRLHDPRLKRRLFDIAQDFYNRSQASIPEACGSKARTMGAYRFFQNDKITMDVILTPHTEATLERIKTHRIVLAPQDTTTLNYHHHPATSGMGPINTKADKATGLIVHDTLAFSEDGTPLGVLDAQCWARDPDDRGKRERRKSLPIEQKESMKWLRSFRKLAEIQALCPDTLLVSIGDRESDLYELFAEATRDSAGPKLLVRAERSRNRRIEQGPLWDTICKQPMAGELKLQIPRRGNRRARKALLEVRFSAVELQPPKASRLPPVPSWAVHLRELQADDGGEPIEWMLLTTVAVTTFEQAVQRAEWYAGRWGIEVYHRTLKSGCRIKDRQLGTSERLQACLGVDMVVAWRIYHLTMLGREVPEQPCTAFFEEVEWKALYCYHHKTPVAPAEPPTMTEAIRMLGAMGGHLGRKRDGPPGPQALWRALQRLDTAVQMYALFTQSSLPNSWNSYPHGYPPPQNPP
jgi:hypothetical protein